MESSLIYFELFKFLSDLGYDLFEAVQPFFSVLFRPIHELASENSVFASLLEGVFGETSLLFAVVGSIGFLIVARLIYAVLKAIPVA